MNDDHELRDLFGEVIHAYTRADAIADGAIVDVSAAAREAGIRHPVALTRACHRKITSPQGGAGPVAAPPPAVVASACPATTSCNERTRR